MFTGLLPNRMKTRSASTAILLFARSTAAEMQEKWLPKGERIYSLLNQRALALAEESGLALFHSTEDDQIGEDFGSRFAHAIQQIFDQGYTSVISIGNDTPQLRQNDIQLALEQLRDNKSVIGPSKDGGIYLLGIHAADYDHDAFRKVKWCTAQVQGCLAEYFRTRERTLSFLQPYSDLDSTRDLSVLSNLRHFIPIGILNTIRSAIQQVVAWFELPEIRSEKPLWQPHLNKGSPQ